MIGDDNIFLGGLGISNLISSPSYVDLLNNLDYDTAPSHI
jgi:hypothetical protein